VRPLPESFDEEEDELELELPDEEEDEEEEEFDEESLSSLSSDVSTPPAAQKRLMVAVVWGKKQDRMNRMRRGVIEASGRAGESYLNR